MMNLPIGCVCSLSGGGLSSPSAHGLRLFSQRWWPEFSICPSAASVLSAVVAQLSICPWAASVLSAVVAQLSICPWAASVLSAVVA